MESHKQGTERPGTGCGSVAILVVDQPIPIVIGNLELYHVVS